MSVKEKASVQSQEHQVNTLWADEKQAARLQATLSTMPSWSLSYRQLCDIELLLNGGFSPLTGFLGRDDYEGVVNDMRLKNGALWPMPITLDVDDVFAQSIGIGLYIALRDPEGVAIAVMQITDKWRPDKGKEAKAVFGSDQLAHPAVQYLYHQAGDVYIGGPVIGLQRPVHYDFTHLRHSPNALRAQFKTLGWQQIVAFQTRNPMHRAHQALTQEAAKACGANLLIHPVVGLTKPGDIDHYTRVRCYEKILTQYPSQTAMLSLLPLAMRMAGPREALWHAIIRRNYGCTHFIVGRDHAGLGEAFYGLYDAQDLVMRFEKEIGIQVVPFKEMVYVAQKKQYIPMNHVTADQQVLRISGTLLRQKLRAGQPIPDWFSFPGVIDELRVQYPAKKSQGFCVFLTGLSGAGKSTLANALLVKLMEMGGRSVSLLDGDRVRKKLCSDLGFSKADRDTNVMRTGFVASEIVKHTGIAICALIAPYAAMRTAFKQAIVEHGGFFEVHVSTPLDVCEARDRKGLYEKARAGLISEFTGISDPYEAPCDPDMVLNTAHITVEEGVQMILSGIEKAGYITTAPA